MNLYLISQTKVGGYDSFDSAVVVAKNAGAARRMHPKGTKIPGPVGYSTWTNNPRDVTATLLGKAKGSVECVVCASFNAG